MRHGIFQPNIFYYLLLFALSLSACKPSTPNAKVSEQVIRQNWYLASSKTVGNDIAVVRANLEKADWIRAAVPGTVFGSLVEAGVYKDPFWGTRMDSIPAAPFQTPWWFKTTFNLQNFSKEHEAVALFIDGINYRADIWLNNQQIATKDSIYGAFKQFKLAINQAAKEGENTLLVKVYPPEVRDFYMGFVDWAPTPPDHFMGIFRDIRLKRSGKVMINDAFFKTDFNPADTSQAALTVDIEVQNTSSEVQELSLSLHTEQFQMERPIKLQAFEKRTIHLDPLNFPELTLKNPRLWWPNGLGSPQLYRAHLALHQKGELVDSTSKTFGIRKIETYLSKTGVRRYKVNGREILIKAAGWVDDLFLRYQPAKDSAQISYVKDMHLNALRFEGIWGNNHHLYDLCDQNGILLMLGWSCQWEWPDYLGLPLAIKPGDENLPINEGVERYAVKLQAKEKTLLADYFRDQVKWLRNHPSIFTWVGGSDAMPPPDLEQRYLDTLAKYDPTRPFLLSAGEFNSKVSGKSGMKMNGPYQYVPPVYWYEDKKLGGAFGFNSETGPGPQIPPLKSIEKMIPKDQLWPADNPTWNYHSGRKDFATMGIYLQALNTRYGPSKDLASLAFKSQLINYEAMRPMFEAHVINRKQASGVVQWMLNSPWPEFYWQLYDYYMMPNGAYFGTKKALQPVTLIYNYHDRKVYISNDTRQSVSQHKALIQLYDAQSKILMKREIPLILVPDAVHAIAEIPALTAAQSIAFLDLKILDSKGNLVADNFYWLASRMDQLDWATYSWFYTPSKQFADFRSLEHIPKADVQVSKKVMPTDAGNSKIVLTCKNKSSFISFFNEFQLFDKEQKDNIVPITWSDNYFSLLPYETKTIEVSFPTGKEPLIQLQSVNGEKRVF